MSDPSVLAILGRLLPSLAIIVGALLVVRWWTRRAQGGTGHLPVRIVGRTGVAKGAAVAVVAVGERRFLVGAGDHGVTLLSELDPDAAAPALAPDPLAIADPQTPRDDSSRRLVDQLRAMTVRTPVERVDSRVP